MTTTMCHLHLVMPNLNWSRYQGHLALACSRSVFSAKSTSRHPMTDQAKATLKPKAQFFVGVFQVYLPFLPRRFVHHGLWCRSVCPCSMCLHQCRSGTLSSTVRGLGFGSLCGSGGLQAMFMAEFYFFFQNNSSSFIKWIS